MSLATLATSCLGSALVGAWIGAGTAKERTRQDKHRLRAALRILEREAEGIELASAEYTEAHAQVLRMIAREPEVAIQLRLCDALDASARRFACGPRPAAARLLGLQYQPPGHGGSSRRLR